MGGRYLRPMGTPDPLVVAWQVRQLRVRHDDPRLGPYSPRGATIRAAAKLASDVEGFRSMSTSSPRGGGGH